MRIAPSHMFVQAMLGLLVASTLGLAWIYWNIYGAAGMFGDFSIFYQAGRHALAHELQAVYDIPRLQGLLSVDSHGGLSFFLNPPTALFFVYPLGFLSPAPALWLWTGLQIALLCAALGTDYIGRLFRSASPRPMPASILLAIPFLAFSLQNLLFGQMALFCTALFLGVMALRTSRPILAGVALGMFSLKPQLGLLLPVLLLAERNWKTLLSATLTTLAMIALSLCVFGIPLWQDYREALAILGQFLARPQPALFALTTSPYAAMRNLGLPATGAYACQCALSLLVLAIIWPVLRRGKEQDKILIVTLGTYLVSPYSLIYDIPLLAIPCALWLKRADEDKAAIYELVALLLLIALPLAAVLLQIAHIPYSVIAIGGAFGVARRLAFKRMDTHAVTAA